MVTLHEGLGASACGCSPLGSPFHRAHLTLQTYHETFIPFGLASLPSPTSGTLSLLALSVLASYCPHPALQVLQDLLLLQVCAGPHGNTF